MSLPGDCAICAIAQHVHCTAVPWIKGEHNAAQRRGSHSCAPLREERQAAPGGKEHLVSSA